MSFWRGERLAQSSGVVDPFNADQIDCNAYTLRMGGTYYRTGEREAGFEQKPIDLKEGEWFVIPPGQFAFLLSKETVRVPEHAMAFISMRTAIKFQGLINVSGFHVDPGYKGRLIYAVYNASPAAIQLREGDRIFKIWFCDLGESDNFASPSIAPYVFDGKGLNGITGDMVKGMNQEIYSLQSLAEQIREQKSEISAQLAEQKSLVDNLNIVWRTLVVGGIGALILGLFTLIITFSLPIVHEWGNNVATYYREKTELTKKAKQELVIKPAAQPPQADKSH